MLQGRLFSAVVAADFYIIQSFIFLWQDLRNDYLHSFKCINFIQVVQGVLALDRCKITNKAQKLIRFWGDLRGKYTERGNTFNALFDSSILNRAVLILSTYQMYSIWWPYKTLELNFIFFVLLFVRPTELRPTNVRFSVKNCIEVSRNRGDKAWPADFN